jgi:hypothetical protein
MKEKSGEPSSGPTKSKPKRPPVRTSRNWWPYVIAGGVVVLVGAFVAVTQLGRAGDGAGVDGRGLAVGSPVPTDSVPSSGGRTVSLADLRGSRVVVYFYEGGA